MAGMSVGEVAGRLGVSASTVRMWGRRYGLTASERSTGGHRRFSQEDFGRLLRMQQLVIAGTDPAAAAASVLAPGAAASPARGRGGPGGAVLAVPGADPRVRGLARAAGRLQEGVVSAAVLESLEEHGVLPTWNDLVLPVLVAAGEHWHASGAGIEIEHLLTEAVTTAFTSFARGSAPAGTAQVSGVVLAAGPGEDHMLTLHALRAALWERGVVVRFLGARTPLAALCGTVRLTRAPAVFIWATMPARLDAADLATLRAARRGLTVAVGGPGWQATSTAPAVLCESLEAAVSVLDASWRGVSHTA